MNTTNRESGEGPDAAPESSAATSDTGTGGLGPEESGSAGSEVRRSRALQLPDAEVQALLDRATSAVIAFVDGRGFPRMVPCWFVWWEDAFYTTSGVDKFHVRAIRKDPRGSFCVEVQEITPRRMSNRQVKGVGRFEVIDTEVAEWGARIRRKYLGSAGGPLLADGEGRVVLRLAPERLTAHGGDFMLSRGAGNP